MNPDITGFYPIKGKVVLSKEERHFPHIPIVTQTIQSHLKRQGLWKVKQESSGSVSFCGWSGAHSGFCTLSKVVGTGFAVVSIENSQMIARYYLRPGFIFTLGALFPLTITVMEMNIHRVWYSLDWWVSLLLVAGITFGTIRFFPKRGMKEEFKRAFQIALDAIDDQD